MAKPATEKAKKYALFSRSLIKYRSRSYIHGYSCRKDLFFKKLTKHLLLGKKFAVFRHILEVFRQTVYKYTRFFNSQIIELLSGVSVLIRVHLHLISTAIDKSRFSAHKTFRTTFLSEDAIRLFYIMLNDIHKPLHTLFIVTKHTSIYNMARP